MPGRIRVKKHEAIPGCGSFEVQVPGKPSRYFYWDDIAGRRLRPETLTREQALEQAKALARAERTASLLSPASRAKAFARAERERLKTC